MKTLKQIVCNDCFYENELPDCPKFCPLTFNHVRKWLQQKQKELCLIDDEWDNAQKSLFEELLEELKK